MQTESDLSDSVSDSSLEDVPRLDDLGRPLERPVFRPIGESSVLSRVKEFLPLIKAAGLHMSEPKVRECNQGGSSDIKIPLNRKQSEDSVSSQSGASSFGVEVDVGLGVYDINGVLDEDTAEKMGVPIIESNPAMRDSNVLHQYTKSTNFPTLIQEINEGAPI